jgi:hypothetical protein
VAAVTEVRKYGGTVLVSRQSLLDHGLVEPTDEERRERDAWHAAYEQRKQAATAAWPGFVAALDAVTDPVARAVLDLHRQERGWCTGENGDTYGEPEEWPCLTVLAVAATLGIDVPPDLDIAEQARG